MAYWSIIEHVLSVTQWICLLCQWSDIPSQLFITHNLLVMNCACPLSNLLESLFTHALSVTRWNTLLVIPWIWPVSFSPDMLSFLCKYNAPWIRHQACPSVNRHAIKVTRLEMLTRPLSEHWTCLFGLLLFILSVTHGPCSLSATDWTCPGILWDTTKTGKLVILVHSSAPNWQMASVSHSKLSFS